MGVRIVALADENDRRFYPFIARLIANILSVRNNVEVFFAAQEIGMNLGNGGHDLQCEVTFVCIMARAVSQVSRYIAAMKKWLTLFVGLLVSITIHAAPQVLVLRRGLEQWNCKAALKGLVGDATPTGIERACQDFQESEPEIKVLELCPGKRPHQNASPP